MEENVRIADGRFRKGAQSPNPAGRRGRARFVTPSDLRRTIIAISERPTVLQVKGEKLRKTTLLGWHIYSMAAGDAATRLASKDFIELVRRATLEEEYGPRLEGPLDRIPPEIWNGFPVPAGTPLPPVKRDGRGRFADSGNPRGRPRKVEPLLSTAQDIEMLAMANLIVTPKNGRAMPLFEDQVLRLGRARGRTRVATRRWIEFVLAAAGRLARLREEALAHEIIAAWKSRDDAALEAARRTARRENLVPGAPQQACEFEYISLQMWNAMVKEAGSVEEFVRQAAEAQEGG